MTHKWSYYCLNWKIITTFIFVICVFNFNIKPCLCDDWEYKLFSDLLGKYDPSIRPSMHHNMTLNVTFSLALAQIIDVVKYFISIFDFGLLNNKKN
jgi:hypothetical protein